MIDYLITLGAWNWLILGAVFLTLELAAPGAFMLWLGLAALAVGLISFRGRLVLAGAALRLCGVVAGAPSSLAPLRAES